MAIVKFLLIESIKFQPSHCTLYYLVCLAACNKDVQMPLPRSTSEPWMHSATRNHLKSGSKTGQAGLQIYTSWILSACSGHDFCHRLPISDHVFCSPICQIFLHFLKDIFSSHTKEVQITQKLMEMWHLTGILVFFNNHCII